MLPLANYRDKVTQVTWGIHDFEYRFGRYPEGMWLAETAVNAETLEVPPITASSLPFWRHVKQKQCAYCPMPSSPLPAPGNR